jgi:hypothetical protein
MYPVSHAVGAVQKCTRPTRVERQGILPNSETRVGRSLRLSRTGVGGYPSMAAALSGRFRALIFAFESRTHFLSPSSHRSARSFRWTNCSTSSAIVPALAHSTCARCFSLLASVPLLDGVETCLELFLCTRGIVEGLRQGEPFLTEFTEDQPTTGALLLVRIPSRITRPEGDSAARMYTDHQALIQHSCDGKQAASAKAGQRRNVVNNPISCLILKVPRTKETRNVFVLNSLP